MVLPPLDFELGEGVSQSRAHHCRFFFVQMLSQARFSAAPGFLGFSFVDILCTNGHVRHDGHPFAGDFHKAFADGQEPIRHHYFGEGEYAQSEMVIQQLLAEAGSTGAGTDLVSVDPETEHLISRALELNPKTVSSRLSKCLDRLETIARMMFAGEKSPAFPSNP